MISSHTQLRFSIPKGQKIPTIADIRINLEADCIVLSIDANNGVAEIDVYYYDELSGQKQQYLKDRFYILADVTPPLVMQHNK